MLQIATTLDPRFKTLPNVIEESRRTLDSPIKDMLKNLIDEAEAPKQERSELGESSGASKKSRLSGKQNFTHAKQMYLKNYNSRIVCQN